MKSKNFIITCQPWLNIFRFLQNTPYEKIPSIIKLNNNKFPVNKIESDLIPPTNNFEAHRKNIDLHICYQGGEAIHVWPKQKMTITKNYDEQQDYELFTPPKFWHTVILKPYSFALIFPESAHRPLCIFSNEKQVKKIVIKINLKTKDNMEMQ